MGRVGKLVKAIAAFFEDKQEKKIIGVQIGDKKIKTRNATNAYCVVHKFLYAMDRRHTHRWGQYGSVGSG